MNLILKAVAAIGFVMLLVSQLYPGANASWSNFMTGLQSGPSLPSFPTANPSAPPQKVITEQSVIMAPTSNGKLNVTGSWAENPPQSVTNLNGAPLCDSLTWFGCLFPAQDNPAYDEATYVTVGTIDDSFSVNTSSTGDQTNGHYVVDAVSALVLCRSVDATSVPGRFMQIGVFQRATGLGTSGGMIELAQMDGYGFCANTTWSYYAVQGRIFPHPVAGLNWTVDSFSGVGLYIQDGLDGYGHETEIASIILIAGYSQVTSACPGGFDGIGCQFGQLFRGFQNFLVSLWNGIALFCNFIIYILQLVVAIVSWIVTLFANFFIGLFGSIAYFYNLPGMPTFLQGIVDVIMTVFIGTIFLAMGAYVVGLIGGVVNKA